MESKSLGPSTEILELHHLIELSTHQGHPLVLLILLIFN
jgi:hypothetical protein